MNKTAIIIGATGLIGKNLLQQLLQDEDYSIIKIFVRRPTGIQHKKLREMVIDFEKIEEVKDKIEGDVLFSCLGTTLKQAGSKQAQYQVDYTYQYQFAKLSSENGVHDYLLVSSTSANAKSFFFYSRIKGALEDAVRKLSFKRIIILQPSVLAGERDKDRTGEKWGAAIINTLGKIFPPLRKYRSIRGSTVAAAMVALSKSEQKNKVSVYQLDEIQHLAENTIS
ncbi:MAG: NAD(P)H-binding protein [Saprospiraceae bacterium]|nr:NAD(P)H-binding protein [Saprospiraceae bacterium]